VNRDRLSFEGDGVSLGRNSVNVSETGDDLVEACGEDSRLVGD